MHAPCVMQPRTFRAPRPSDEPIRGEATAFLWGGDEG
jgi:hypothetical protein